jgi:hypothetical protein
VDVTVIDKFAQFGVGALFGIVILFAYRQLVGKLTEVIQSNTKALTEMHKMVQIMNQELHEHDERILKDEDDIISTHAGVLRIEQTVNKIAERQGSTRVLGSYTRDILG